MGSCCGDSNLSGGAKCVKFTLVFFNIIFFLLGILILAVGIFVLVDPKFSSFKNITSLDVISEAAKAGVNLSFISYCGIAFCVFGGVMLLISFMGCCGALVQIKCLLGLYSTILLMLLLAEIGIGIFAGVYSGKLKSILAPQLQNNLNANYAGDSVNKTGASIGWDIIMYNFQCCGVNNYGDFQNATKWNSNGTQTPRACCKFTSIATNSWAINPVPDNYVDSNCYTNPNTNNSYYETGCYDKVQSLLVQYSSIVIGVSVGIGLILLLGVSFGFHLCRKISKAEDDY